MATTHEHYRTPFGRVCVETWRLTGPFAGMPRCTMSVSATHESGATAKLDNSLGMQGRNMTELTHNALRILRARVLGGDVPTDRVRTYHTSPIGTWQRNHRTGERHDGVFLEMSPNY